MPRPSKRLIMRNLKMPDDRPSGQSMVELAAGLLILVPLALFLFDLYVLSLSNQMVDKIAKDCARAAANQPDQASANAAADTAMQSFTKSPYITDMTVEHPVTYNPNDTVSVTLHMSVHLPVPFPVIDNNPQFVARAVEPIVTVSH